MTQFSQPHPLNQCLALGDNLELLRYLGNETIDLIVTDPPFGKNQNFAGKLQPPMTNEETAYEKQTLEALDIRWPDHPTQSSGSNVTQFGDKWSWDDNIHEGWLEHIKTISLAAAKTINTSRYTHSEAMAAYLTYMTVRLSEMRRVLKPSGSIFLHCDQAANSYLRVLMDAIFGKDNFRNEIVWSYRTGGASRTCYSKKHDTILFYSKTSQWVWNQPKEKSYTKSKSRKPGMVNYGGGYARFHEDEHGVYNWVNMRDVWDISYIGSTSAERVGYPTQKPVALAERIIRAASNPDGVVLDPFSGSGYVPVAAERLARQWIACDINPRVVTVLRRRFKQNIGSVQAPLLTADHVNVRVVNVADI